VASETRTVKTHSASAKSVERIFTTLQAAAWERLYFANEHGTRAVPYFERESELSSLGTDHGKKEDSGES